MSFFVAKNIIKNYANHRALDDVSIEIPEGAIYGLLGPNGAGKTSLIRIINQITGPAIGPCCFETDGDVPEALRAALGAAAEPFMAWNGSKWHIDLKAVNALWLRREGVTCIDICDHCTACRPDLYWSHRKMGLRRGEQAALIALREDTL